MASNDYWQRAEEMTQKHEGSSTWLKLSNDGDQRTLVFIGEPYPHEVCFVDGKYQLFGESLREQGLRPSVIDLRTHSLSPLLRYARLHGRPPCGNRDSSDVEGVASVESC